MDRLCAKWDSHARVLEEMKRDRFSNDFRPVLIRVEGWHLFGTTHDKPLTSETARELSSPIKGVTYAHSFEPFAAFEFRW